MINQENVEIFLDLLEFMGEDSPFLYDYIEHKETYTNKIFSSYTAQHKDAGGGMSVSDSPQAIYYTKERLPRLLQAIDQKLEKMNPVLWNKYLKRFQTRVF